MFYNLIIWIKCLFLDSELHDFIKNPCTLRLRIVWLKIRGVLCLTYTPNIFLYYFVYIRILDWSTQFGQLKHWNIGAHLEIFKSNQSIPSHEPFLRAI